MTKINTTVKAVLFDVDDTLYDLADPFKKAYLDLFPEKEGLPLDGLFTASRKYSDLVFDKSQSGEMSMEEMYRYRIQHAFADFHEQISDEDAMEFQNHYVEYQGKIRLSATIQEVLVYCASKWRTGIITNGPSGHQWDKISVLGLEKYIPKEHIFVSGDLGISKPGKEIFWYAAAHMGVSPEEVCFVGDSFQNDAAGAKNAGMCSVWFNHRGYARLAGICPDAEVRTEQELYEWLKSF